MKLNMVNISLGKTLPRPQLGINLWSQSSQATVITQTIDEYGNEYWFARDLQKVLEYKEWRNFKVVIDKAITSCQNSEFNVFYHLITLFIVAHL